MSDLPSKKQRHLAYCKASEAVACIARIEYTKRDPETELNKARRYLREALKAIK